MSKKLIAATLCVAGALASSSSFADISPYVSAKLGLGNMDFGSALIKPSGFGFGAAVGARYALENIALRGEFEYAHHIFEDDYDGSVIPFYTLNVENEQKISTYLANFYADLTMWKVKPYVGLSLGMMKINEHVTEHYWDSYFGNVHASDDFSTTSFTWGPSIGIGFNFTDSFGADIGARYLLANIESISAKMFTGSLGLRYTF